LLLYTLVFNCAFEGPADFPQTEKAFRDQLASDLANYSLLNL
jgi:hypothetical protein